MRRDPRPPRELRRDREGNLFDVEEHRQVDLAELAEDVRGGRRFRVRHHDGDVDCTQQVLLQVLGAAALPTPRFGQQLGAALPGLVGSLGAVLDHVRDGDSEERAREKTRAAAERRRRRETRDNPLLAPLDTDEERA